MTERKNIWYTKDNPIKEFKGNRKYVAICCFIIAAFATLAGIISVLLDPVFDPGFLISRAIMLAIGIFCFVCGCLNVRQYKIQRKRAQTKNQ